MRRCMIVRFWVLTIFLVTAPLPAQITSTATSSRIEIEEWPRNLRTDLRGTSIKVVLPENALDQPWDDALVAKFHELTGITVQIVRPGNDTTVVLAGYLRDFASGSTDADVYAIDIVWPGILSDYAEDLRPAFGSLTDMSAPAQILTGRLPVGRFMWMASPRQAAPALTSKHPLLWDHLISSAELPPKLGTHRAQISVPVF